MELKERMDPKTWLIVGGVVQLGFAIWLMLDASSFAESGWGTMTERELEIATTYELFWGWFSVPWAVWAFKQYQTTGKTPELLRDERCPGIKELHARRPPKNVVRFW